MSVPGSPSPGRYDASRQPAWSRPGRLWRRIALRRERALVYADASALVKLVIEEPESVALSAYLSAEAPAIATSRLALVEVPRATAVANPSDEVRAETERLLESCLLVDVTDGLLRAAASLTYRAVRTLDAIHLATARRVDADEMLVYDRRLRAAARAMQMPVAHPGMTG